MNRNDVAHLCVWRDDGESNPMREKLRKLSTIHPMMGSRLPPRMSIHNNLHQPMQSVGVTPLPRYKPFKLNLWGEMASARRAILSHPFKVFMKSYTQPPSRAFLAVKSGVEPP